MLNVEEALALKPRLPSEDRLKLLGLDLDGSRFDLLSPGHA